jgi:hypothetical protein
MREETNKIKLCVVRLLSVCVLPLCFAQSSWAQHVGAAGEREFGPVVRAYLGYLNAEQEVTDARESRREVSAAYVRRNSNRISALRRMALQIARSSRNDYVPELYAVARDELGTLFETPPSPATFRVGEVLNNTFRFLGTVRANEPFYLFARLDIYEQAELIKKAEAQHAGATNSQPAGTRAQGEAATRPRRVSPP